MIQNWIQQRNAMNRKFMFVVELAPIRPYRPKTKKIPIQKYLGKPNKNVRDTLAFFWYFFFRKTEVFVQKRTKLEKTGSVFC